MKIFMIWARSHNEIWLVAAWDDESIGANPEGYQEELDKARRDHGANDVAVTISEINFNAVRKSFEPGVAGLSNPTKVLP